MPSDIHPGPGGRLALSSQVDRGRAWSLSGGWCCTGLLHGMAGSDTCLPGGTGGLCVQAGRGRRRSPHGQRRWNLGHKWPQHSRPGFPRSRRSPSHSHTRNGSRLLSSGRCPRFCSAWGLVFHTHPRLLSSPSLSRFPGRGSYRCLPRLGRFPHSDTGAQHSRLGSPHTPRL